MKKISTKFRKDNKGVTLILAIVAVAFVGILAASIISATMTNYRLKMMNKYSQETFYSADSVIEEMRTGLGIACFDALSDAYEYAARNLLDQFMGAGTVQLTQKSNEEANLVMKQKYEKIIANTLFGGSQVMVNKSTVISFFNSTINSTEDAKVISVGDVTQLNASYGYRIEDVTIEYKKSTGNPYYSTVTIDVDMVYPDITIDFISDKKELKTYLDYCLIALDKVSVGYDETNKGYATISGGIYAGDNGLTINPGSSFVLADDLKVGGQTKVDTVLVTGGDIDLLGGNSMAFFQVGGSDVWCNGINVGKETYPGRILYTSAEARTFVADDLTLDGTDSNVVIKGSYLGFGSNNSNTTGTDKNSSTSSAIIVNGQNCTLDLTGLKTLLLAGKAYVNLTEQDEYMTGDSLALKGNQEIYLVPSGYLKAASTASNPINVANPSLNSSDVKVELTNFFAKRLGLLSDKGYVERKDENGKTYFYLEFASREAQNEYVRCIIQDGYLEAKFNSMSVSYETSDIAEKNAIEATVELGVQRFFDGDTEVKLAGGASVYTSGTLLQVTDSSVSIYAGSTMSFDSVVGMSSSAANKFKIIKSFLDFEEDAAYVPFPSEVVINGGKYEVDPDDLPTIYERVVDVDKLDELNDNIIHTDGATIAAVLTSKDTLASSSYTVPATINGGVILGYGVDIVVDHNFEGLIMTDGKIYIRGTAAATPGIDNRAELTLDVYKDVAEYFYTFKETSDTQQIDEIDLNEVIEFSNWRKNENVYEDA